MPAPQVFLFDNCPAVRLDLLIDRFPQFRHLFFVRVEDSRIFNRHILPFCAVVSGVQCKPSHELLALLRVDLKCRNAIMTMEFLLVPPEVADRIICEPLQSSELTGITTVPVEIATDKAKQIRTCHTMRCILFAVYAVRLRNSPTMCALITTLIPAHLTATMFLTMLPIRIKSHL